MKLALKGIIDESLLDLAKDLGFEVVSFDFRPRSFNFTQGYKVKEMLSSFDSKVAVTLMFENEKDFMVSEIHGDLERDSWVEFSGQSDLGQLDKIGIPFVWHYDEVQTLSQIKSAKNLKRIVFSPTQLEHYSQSGELIPILQLLKQETRVEIEILNDWDSSLMLSLLDAVEIDCLSLEINNKVEKSYRNIDQELIKLHMVHINEAIGKEKEA